MRLRFPMALASLVAVGLAVRFLEAETDLTLDQDHPAILWRTADVHDAVAQLNTKVEAGAVTLSHSPTTGYLADVLQALRIPVSSQMLVYSKSSLQRSFIHPENPRALYFNDSAVIGFIPGSPFLEAAVHDPQQGVIFYTLNQAAKQGSARFLRQTSCTMCHETAMGVPGFVLQSIPTAPDGQALYQLGYWPSNDKTPFENRWGGWFVTGRHEPFPHMGNRLIANSQLPGSLAAAAPAMEKAPGVSEYPAQTSDIAALLVFEHQAETANWITRVGWHARIAVFHKQPMAEIQPTVNALVDAMLFTGEVALPKPVKGTSGFAEEFAAMGPRDKQGRSLRDLELTHNVFRYPMSYLIYSQAFDALPSEARAMVYERLWKVLSGQMPSAQPRLDVATRRAIVEILADTKKDLPAYFAARSVNAGSVK